jgi:plasmid stabilization system protein ParE
MPRRKLRFTRSAERDLAGILAYVSNEALMPHSAHAFVEDIRTHCLTLLDFPEVGWNYGHIRENLRAQPYRTVVIVFDFDPNFVRVRRIFGQRQNYRRLLRR